MNSSNVFMELGGIVRRQAEALGAQAVLVQHERDFRPGETRNKWVLVTKNATFLRAIARHVDPWRNMSTTLGHSRAAFSEPRLWWGDS